MTVQIVEFYESIWFIDAKPAIGLTNDKHAIGLYMDTGINNPVWVPSQWSVGYNDA